MKEGQKGEDAHYHSLLMARISDAEEKERGRKEAQQFKSKCIVRIQKEQLQKSREAVLAQRRAEMEEGDREKVAIAEQIEEEKRKAKELILQKRVEMERMISANQDLRATRGKTCERSVLYSFLWFEEAENSDMKFYLIIDPVSFPEWILFYTKNVY